VDPEEITITSEGRILVLDEDRRGIVALNERGSPIAEYGNSYLGQIPFSHNFRSCDALAVAPNGEIVIVEIGKHHPRLFICSPDLGKVVKVIKPPATDIGPIQGPEGIAIDAAGRMYISSEDNRRVLIYDQTGKAIGGFEVPEEPEGIAVLPDGSLIATTFPKRDMVGLFLSNGTPRKIWHSWSKDSFSAPESACFSPDGQEIYFGDCDNGRILVFDLNGVFLRQIGSLGAAQGQLRSVDGMAFNPKGELVACDPDNRCLVVFKPDGIFCREIRPMPK